jgi:multicomponent Na+:H+ antiporter subunit E
MKKNIKMLSLACVLFLFWMLLTSSLSLFEIALGIGVSLFVSWLSFHLLENEVNLISLSLLQFIRLLLYLPYLIKEIIKANVDVAERVLRPELPISPMIVRFRFPLKTPISQTTMANSITLTPGTLTVNIDEEGIFYIHCLAEAHAESLLEGDLRRHVLWVYEGGKSD